MQAAAETASELERHLDLELPMQAIESEVEARLKRLARTVKLHGFRPGKVPLKIVAQQYGGQVRQEVLSDSVQKAFSDAVRERNLRVAGLPRLSQKDGGAERLAFTATFEVYPEVTLGDLSTQRIREPDTLVTDADVDRTIEILRKQRVHFHATERAAQTGDRVTIDFDGMRDGQPFAGGSGQKVHLVIGESRFLPDFEANLVGLVSGAQKSFDVVFPADYHAKDLAGQNVTFSVSVSEVGAPHLPELDENFAKSLGIDDGDLARMRQEIRGNLEREVKKRVHGKVKDQAMQALIDTSTLAVPKALVDGEVRRLGEQAVRDLQSRGLAAKDIKLPPELFTAQAERRVRLGLILAEVVKRNHLQPKPEQVRAVVDEHAQSYEQPQEMVRWYYQNPERLGEVEAVVVEDNVVNWVLSQAQVEKIPTPFQELVEQPKAA